MSARQCTEAPNPSFGRPGLALTLNDVTQV